MKRFNPWLTNAVHCEKSRYNVRKSAVYDDDVLCCESSSEKRLRNLIVCTTITTWEASRSLFVETCLLTYQVTMCLALRFTTSRLKQLRITFGNHKLIVQ